MSDAANGRTAASTAARVDTDALLAWWRGAGRDFPWRSTDNAFHVLCAEFMLRRTRALQVVPVYETLIREYPTASAVTDAPEARIKSILAPLGLNWRIAQFRKLCIAICADHGGDVPSHYDELLTLPGVGPYVASAVRVFAFGEPDPLIDTNVLRFISRYLGVELSDSSRRSPRVLEDVRQLVPADDPQSFWWAILDLAASVCTPTSPEHEDCPLRGSCNEVAETGAGRGATV